MLEGDNISESEDLSQFADYLAEFDSVIGFDSEICPVCGVELSSTLAMRQSQFFKYKSFDNDSELSATARYLDSKSIPYKIEKRLKSDVDSKICYIFDVLVPLRYLPDIEKIF